MEKNNRHPIQPLLKDGYTLRFKENSIIRYILDNGGIDMNHIAEQEFPNEDRVQFAQLIGYSLKGFGELSYVSDSDYYLAEALTRAVKDERDVRIEFLENENKKLKDLLSGICKTIDENTDALQHYMNI